MSRPKRLTGFLYRGIFRYSLTFCTFQRRERFRDAALAAATIAQFQRTAVDESFAILVYCLMPDHAHFLVEGLNAHSDLRRFAKIGKQRSGASCALGGGGRLWQEGYYEHVLRHDEDARAVARYILANPVRAGIVRSVEDYPYLGSDAWTIRELIDSII